MEWSEKLSLYIKVIVIENKKISKEEINEE